MKEHDLMDDEDYSDLSQDEKNLATLSHLGTFVGVVLPGMGNILVPFLIWMLKKEDSDYIAAHAKEALNFQITISLLFILGAISIIILIGFVALPILVILDIALCISAAVKASRGEYYEYPINFRLIK